MTLDAIKVPVCYGECHIQVLLSMVMMNLMASECSPAWDPPLRVGL
jgi:hypothetical protein